MSDSRNNYSAGAGWLGAAALIGAAAAGIGYLYSQVAEEEPVANHSRNQGQPTGNTWGSSGNPSRSATNATRGHSTGRGNGSVSGRGNPNSDPSPSSTNATQSHPSGRGSTGRRPPPRRIPNSVDRRTQDATCKITDEIFEGETECAICLRTDGSMYKLSCNNAFHRACINPYLSDHPKCPVCGE